MNKKKCLLCLFFLFFVTCGSIPEKANSSDNKIVIPETTLPEDKYSVNNYEAEQPDKYERFLVAIEDYTTNGDYYHKKHKKYLLGIAEILTSKHGYKLKPGTIGFYFDKVENKKSKLYLGLDVVCEQAKLKGGEGYYETGRRMIDEYLGNTLMTVHRYDDIFSENEVEGAVVGLFWYRAGKGEFINVWLPKQNINEYFNDQLTFNELVLKATVTDINGKKIRLTL